MKIDSILRAALEKNATDIHLEPAQPVTFRIRGQLHSLQQVLSSQDLQQIARQLAAGEGESLWNGFLDRGSADFTKLIMGVHCRVNVMKGHRGLGLAVRLLPVQVKSIRNCNLHPGLAELVQRDSGLILIAGSTGSGKSTTMAALLEEINQNKAAHIITLEHPVEYRLKPKKSFIRQREIEKHTPSFSQGLRDCLREDPDVIAVGEMRDSETMQLVLNAAETGHLVLSTMHSSSCAEALYRVMMAFSGNNQGRVLSQIADSLVAIVTQRMSYNSKHGILIPCCEILVANHAVKTIIRKGEMTKVINQLQTGAQDGLWTFERYQGWIDSHSDWVKQTPPENFSDPEIFEDMDLEAEDVAVEEILSEKRIEETLPRRGLKPVERVMRAPPPSAPESSLEDEEPRIVIPEMDHDLDQLVREISNRRKK